MPTADPNAFALRFTIPPDQAGRALLPFLLARFPCFSDAAWHERLTRGRLTLNGTATSPDATLRTGDRIAYLDWDIPEPDVNTAYSIVHQDHHLLAVNKPAGLPCHPGGRYRHNCLTALLRRDLAPETLILVNRLDRETSGLVLVALNHRAAKLTQQQFARRQVEKRYIAFVEGNFPESLEADGLLVRDSESVVFKRRRFIPRDASPGSAVLRDADAESALTRFTLIKRHGPLSEIGARPATGRTHQIRATLLALGFPLVGDKLYGRDPAIFLRFCNGQLTEEDHRILRLDRQALHAATLSLRHPATRQPLDLEAPLPADLAGLRTAP